MSLRLSKIKNWFKQKSTKTLVLIGLAGLVSLCVAGGGAYAALGGSPTRPVASTDIELQRGLVGWWNMNGNAKDSTPNANNGTVTGATLASDQRGSANSAYSFTSNTNVIAVPASSALNQSVFTYSAWVNPSSFSTNGTIIGSSVNGGPQFAIQTNGKLALNKQNVTGLQLSLGALSLNTWNLVSVTYNASTGALSYYINGNLDRTVTATALTFSFSSLNFGKRADTAESFSGSMNNIRIYNRILNAAEEKQLYQQYNPGIKSGSGQNGLEGWWKLNGNTKDATPNAQNGTITGGVTTATDREGATNGAYAFDGSSGYISAGNTPALQTTFSAFTWSAWVNSSNITKDQMYLSKQSANYARIVSSKPYNSFSIGGAQKVLAGTTTLSANTWYMLSATYDGSAMRIYVNGVLSNTLSGLSGTLNFNTGAFDIGHWTNADPRYLAGSMADVRLYNRALATSELLAQAQSYNSQISLNSSPTNNQTVNLNSGLIGYWPFNGNLKDATPYQNTATASGALATADRKTQTNRAYSLNGTTDSIVATLNNLSSSAISVSGWFYAGTYPSSYTRFMNKNWAGNGSWLLYLSSNGRPIFGVVDATATQRNAQCNPSTFTLGAWHHLVGTYDGATVKLYLDGALCVTSLSAAGISLNTTPTVQLGAPAGGTGAAYSEDDIRIYNRALSAAEVTALYNSYY